MTTRRDFLKAGAAAVTTGIVFCSCGLLQSAHAQQRCAKSYPSQSAANGSKPSTCTPIATSAKPAHCSAPMPPRPASAGQQCGEAFIEIDKRLAAMDAQAIDLEVLSINPYWYNRERDLAAEIVKIQNEKLAELCASKPDRFAAFASLTLQAPDLAVQELDTAVKKQGLKGAAIGGVVNGVEFSDPNSIRCGPRRSSSACPCSSIRRACLNSASALPATAGSQHHRNPLETTIALSHLIFEGTLDRFPG